MTPFLLLGCFLAMALLGVDRSQVALLLVPWSVAFVILLASFRKGAPGSAAIFLWAAAFRAILLLTTPDLSDDHFRYLWDGLISLQGVSPYALTPLEAAAQGLGSPILLPLLNSPEYHSVYPPLSQLLFLLPAWSLSFWGWEGAFRLWRFLLVGVELMGLAFLLRASARDQGKTEGVGPRSWSPRSRLAVLYAWNPLVVLATAGSGHTEALLVPGLAMLALGVMRDTRSWAWAGLAMAGMVKLIPFVLAPFLLRWSISRSPGWWKAPLWAAAGCGALTVAFWTPGALRNLQDSLNLYVQLFEYNAGLYFLLKDAALSLTGQDQGKLLGPLLRAAFLLGVLVITVRHPVTSGSAWLRGAVAVFSLYLVTATTVHPWYLLWLLPLLPLAPLLSGAWLWASWAALPTYLSYQGVDHGTLTALFWGGWGAFAGGAVVGTSWPRLLRWSGVRKARKLSPYLGSGSILDVGSGEGWVGEALAQRPGPPSPGSHRVVLSDRYVFNQATLPFVQADGAHLPFPDGGFDAVILSLTLHHMAQPRAALAESRRVARTRILVTESCYRSAPGRRVVLFLDGLVNRFRGGGSFLDAEPVHLRPAEEWEALFQQAHLRIVRRVELNRWVHHWVLWELAPGDVRESAVEPPDGGKTNPASPPGHP
ncbi:MAG: class I SAM-dependent methyltransferase [Gemmatimonadota bacterium]